MRRVVLAYCLLLGLCFFGRAVQAGDGDADPFAGHPVVQAADRVAAAAAAEDPAALGAAAVGSKLDIWLIAEELCFRGDHATALRLARSAAPSEREKLTAYVEGRRRAPPDAQRRSQVLTAHRRLGVEDAAGAVAALEGARLDQEPAGVMAIWAEEVLGLALRKLGDLDAAREAFRRAAPAAERLGWLSMAAASWWRAARLSLERGDPEGAVTAFEAQLGVEDLRGNWAQWPGALLELADALASMGRRAQALDRLDAGVAKVRTLGVKPAETQLLMRVGEWRTDMGDYAGAMSAYERIIDVRLELGNVPGTAQGRILLGNLHARIGNYAEALRLQELALEGMDKAGNATGGLTALGNIGGLLVQLGQLDRGEEVLREALARSRARGDRSAEARFVGNLANLSQERGDHVRALEGYQEEVRLYEALGDEYGATIALGNVGGSLSRLARFAESIDVRRRAIALAEKIADRESLTFNLLGLAGSLRAAGMPAEALPVFERASSELTAMLRGLGEEDGARLRERLGGIFHGGLLAAVETKDTRAIWNFLERGRAAGLLEGLGARGALEGSLLPADLRAADVEARAAEGRALGLLQAARAGRVRGAIAAAKTEYEAAMAGRTRLAERIQREQKRAAGVLYPQPAEVEQVQALLGTDDALLLYAIVEDLAACLVVTHDALRFVRLPGSVAQIEADCAALHLKHADDPTDEPAARLAAAILEPLGLASSNGRLLVSPHGCLSSVPFSMLAPTREIVCVPSGSTLLSLARQVRAPGVGVLALGDPRYDVKVEAAAEPAGRRERGDRLAPLPGTRKEVEAIGDEVLLGLDATRARLVERLATRERWRAVHLACHGLLDLERPLLSALALTAEGRDDGRLRCLDVFAMDVPADLVVLSACETARGKIYLAEGVMGLTRAFLYAGAPRVLCSLWKVDDDATQALMVKFYEVWRAAPASAPAGGAAPPGVRAAQALLEAQAYVRSQERWRHPFYWAAWVLWGLPS